MISILKTIENNLSSFDNNSLLMRYILTFLVFYSHMFAIYGMTEPTLLWGIHSLGWYAVNGFFFISGLLVAQSYAERDIKSYAIARALRIMPAYLLSLVIVLFGVLLFGDAAFSQEWFSNISFRNLVTLDFVNIPVAKMWSETNPFQYNGSIWTIPFEIFCYIIIVPLFLSNNKFTMKKYFLLFVFGLIFLKGLGTFSMNHISLDLLRVIVYFSLGVSVYMIIVRKKNNYFFIASLFVLIYFEKSFGEIVLGYTIITILFFGFYLKNTIKLKDDYSYGIYLYAWPISLAVRGVGIYNIYLGLFVAFVVLMLTSYLSWTYLEKPFLNMKKRYQS